MNACMHALALGNIGNTRNHTKHHDTFVDTTHVAIAYAIFVISLQSNGHFDYWSIGIVELAQRIRAPADP